MKTAKEWFESVDDAEVRELLLQRIYYADVEASSIRNAMFVGLVRFEHMREGSDFWYECFESPDPIAYLRKYIDSKKPISPKRAPYYGQNSPHEVVKFIDAHGLNFQRGNAVKYIARAGKKDPAKEVEDLEKAIHYLQMEVEKLKQ